MSMGMATSDRYPQFGISGAVDPAELRVAIRCGHARGQRLDLTAGAGLVRGSIAERELQEVGLKLAVLADQLDWSSEAQSSPRSRSIT